MRFHLIDRVDWHEPGRRVTARKLTSYSEDHWEDVEGVLRMPPPLLLEAFCQACTWLILITTDRRRRAALLAVGSVTWHRDVRPGEVLVMEGKAHSFGDETAVFSGRVTVDGEAVLECSDVMCALLDADTLAEPDVTERFQLMLTGAGK